MIVLKKGILTWDKCCKWLRKILLFVLLLCLPLLSPFLILRHLMSSYHHSNSTPCTTMCMRIYSKYGAGKFSWHSNHTFESHLDNVFKTARPTNFFCFRSSCIVYMCVCEYVKIWQCKKTKKGNWNHGIMKWIDLTRDLLY